MTEGLSALQNLILVVAGAAAARSSKPNSFLATWRYGQLATLLVDGDTVYAKCCTRIVVFMTQLHSNQTVQKTLSCTARALLSSSRTNQSSDVLSIQQL